MEREEIRKGKREGEMKRSSPPPSLSIITATLAARHPRSRRRGHHRHRPRPCRRCSMCRRAPLR
ncbi:hypothetical protein K523DRAFT_326251 [Schizophyllum commune Tattone D]|nr:hypothetical protein K523DRAFT_326251 [Schizophyllum commune Tattone D]